MPEETKFRERRSKGKMKNNLEEVNFLVKNTIQERGITLIALVVTIIVLLILASISISVILGNNGLIAQAQIAANATEKGAKQEEEKIKDLNDKINTMVNGGEGGGPTIPDEPTLELELEVNEADVTGKVIPISVKKVTKKSDNLEVPEQNFTYTWSYEGSTEYTDGSTHTFSNLDEQKSYTFKCKVETEDGEWGSGEVTVIWFKVEETYFRATDGMTWSDWKISKYPSTMPNNTDCIERVGAPLDDCDSIYNDWELDFRDGVRLVLHVLIQIITRL